MTSNERVQQIRKALGLTLEKFGQRVGVTKQTIGKIENGVNNLTEQMAKSICREFNVDYTWLTTGAGSMFLEGDEQLKEQIEHAIAYGSENRIALIKALLKASDDDIEVIMNLLKSIHDIQNQKIDS